jgi:hypothetical protein
LLAIFAKVPSVAFEDGVVESFGAGGIDERPAGCLQISAYTHCPLKGEKEQVGKCPNGKAADYQYGDGVVSVVVGQGEEVFEPSALAMDFTH